jgi:hypothetical protein
MAWKKSSPAAIARFDALVHVTGAERGLLFGCPVYKLGAERYATLFGGTFVLRLSEADLAAAKKLGAKPFEPLPGRKSAERVVLPKSISSDDKKLKTWVAKAVRFARSG